MVLEALAEDAEPVRLSDLARTIGLPKATVHRMLSNLVARGFAARAGRSYALGPRLFELTDDVRTARPEQLAGAVMPFLVELYERTGGAICVGVLSHDSVVYSDSVCNHGAAGLARRSGERVPAFAAAAGRLLLAYRPGTLRRLEDGTIVDLAAAGQLEPAALQYELVVARRRRIVHLCDRLDGRLEFAAPLFAGDREPVAAITVSGRPGRLDPEVAAAEVVRIAHSASLHLGTTRLSGPCARTSAAGYPS